jgi:hypothetical protein
VLFVLTVAVSLSMAPAPSWWWRVLAGAVTLALGWVPVRTLLFQHGRAAVRRFEWADDGTWHLTGPNGEQHDGHLLPETAGLGPWVLLCWRVDPAPGDDVRSGSSQGSGRRYVLIDARAVSPEAFRALRGRLKLSFRQRDAGQSDDNC